MGGCGRAVGGDKQVAKSVLSQHSNALLWHELIATTTSQRCLHVDSTAQELDHNKRDLRQRQYTMVYSLILFVTRKPGLSLHEFKHHWETTHVPLLKELVGQDFPLGKLIIIFSTFRFVTKANTKDIRVTISIEIRHFLERQ